MDEKVIYNSTDPNTPDGQEGQGAEMQTQSGSEGEPPGDSEPPGEEGDSEEYEEVPAPTGIAALLGENWKKKLLIALAIIFILIIIIILIIPKKPSAKDVTLTWWGLWEDNATMQPLIDGFEKQNPTIKIKYSKQDADKYRDTLITRINNGSGPDIFRYHNSWTPALTEVLAPLPKDVISIDEFIKAYYPVIQNDLILNGAIYGIPMGIDSIALFINTDLLNNAGRSVPKNWIVFREAAKAMTVRDKNTNKIQIAGAALGTYGNIAHAPDILSVMFLQQSINLKKITTAKDRLNSTLTVYSSFSQGDDSVWDNSLDNSQLAFARGQLAMYFGYSWDIFVIEQLKSNKNLKYTINPVPGVSGGKNPTVASYWVEGVSSRSKNQKEAMLFMKYLTQKDTLQKFYTEASKTRLFGEPYPRVDMADELKNNQMVYPFISQLNNAGSTYFASDTHDGDSGLNSRSNAYLQNLVNAIAVDKTSVDTGLRTFIEGMTKVLNENGIQQ